MTWLACILIGAGLTAVAWLAATYPWAALRGTVREWHDRRKPKPMPPLFPVGDYVPGEWVAEYERQNRERP